MKAWKSVDEYIAAAPKEAQPKLRDVRAAIREVAPDAVESISYGMPFYSYKGQSGYKGRLFYFAFFRAHIGLFLIPPIIEEHMEELAEYQTTKSSLHLPLNKPIPTSLIKKLMRDGVKKHEARKLNSHGTGPRLGKSVRK
jgi:uncharacterized protein YdhG (YjbR/CyaY superfamily)